MVLLANPLSVVMLQPGVSPCRSPWKRGTKPAVHVSCRDEAVPRPLNCYYFFALGSKDPDG